MLGGYRAIFLHRWRRRPLKKTLGTLGAEGRFIEGAVDEKKGRRLRFVGAAQAGSPLRRLGHCGG